MSPPPGCKIGLSNNSQQPLDDTGCQAFSAGRARRSAIPFRGARCPGGADVGAPPAHAAWQTSVAMTGCPPPRYGSRWTTGSAETAPQASRRAARWNGPWEWTCHLRRRRAARDDGPPAESAGRLNASNGRCRSWYDDVRRHDHLDSADRHHQQDRRDPRHRRADLRVPLRPGDRGAHRDALSHQGEEGPQRRRGCDPYPAQHLHAAGREDPQSAGLVEVPEPGRRAEPHARATGEERRRDGDGMAARPTGFSRVRCPSSPACTASSACPRAS
jgi:hypothetical protein